MSPNNSQFSVEIWSNFSEMENKDFTFFRKWPSPGGDDRGKTSSRALVFTRCDIQSERL